MLEGMNSENLPLTLTPHRRSVDLSPVSILQGAPVKTYHHWHNRYGKQNSEKACHPS
jgi:hypothetical protein